MNTETSITLSDFTEFLTSGAFVRRGSRYWLAVGLDEMPRGYKTPVISVSCPYFYGIDEAEPFAIRKIFRVEPSELARLCTRFIEEISGKPEALTWSEPSRREFDEAFARVQNLISQGQIDKAVPVNFARAKGVVGPATIARWLLETTLAPETLWPYGVWFGGEGCLGVTPEVLFELEAGRLTTMALAGTLAKADGSAEDLLKSAKDLVEHRIVIEDLRRQLESFGFFRASPTAVMELPKLWHLRTDVQVDLSEPVSAFDLVKRLHPTAALGVYPRLFGWRWMRELPGQESRMRYGAPITFDFGDGRALSLVAIRNVQWRDTDVLLGSGCGLVRDSVLDREWDELMRKRESVRHALGIEQ